MSKKIFIILSSILLLVLAGCNAEKAEQTQSTDQNTTVAAVQMEKTEENTQDMAVTGKTEVIQSDLKEAPIKTETIIKEDSAVEEASVVEVEPEAVAATKGMYKEYTGSTGEEAVLFFAATWCPSCVAADKNLSTEEELAVNVDVFKVDYDSNKDLRDKYGVTSQHTFVRIDANGNLVKKMAGGSNSSDLQALFN